MMEFKGSKMTIKLDKKMFNIDQASGLTKKQKALYKTIVKDQVKMVKHHFKNDGWDLDFDLLRSDIIYDLIGADFFGILAAELLTAMKGKVELIHEKNFILRDPNHKPIYMNRRSGDLIVCENSREAKKYINSKYELIGGL